MRIEGLTAVETTADRRDDDLEGKERTERHQKGTIFVIDSVDTDKVNDCKGRDNRYEFVDRVGKFCNRT